MDRLERVEIQRRGVGERVVGVPSALSIVFWAWLRLFLRIDST